MNQGAYPSTVKKIMKTRLLVLLIVLIMIAPTRGASHPTTTIKGTVNDEKGLPLKSARVTLWLKNALITTYLTDSDGFFELEANPDTLYVLIITADNSSTPGIDYLPARVEVTALEGEELLIVLEPAASLIFEGDIQFIEAPQQPQLIQYIVQDPFSGEIKEKNGFPLVFGQGKSSQSRFLNLSVNHLVVPINEPFKVGINCSSTAGLETESKYLEINDPELFDLDSGDLLRIDVRWFSMQLNLDILEALLKEVDARLNEMDTYGFYTIIERAKASEGEQWLSEAKFLYNEGQFVESFNATKRGYLELVETQTRLTRMIRDASISVYILLVFFALSSTAIAFILSNRDATKLLGSMIVYALCLLVFYNSYPGSLIIPFENFFGAGFLAIGFAVIVVTIFPKFMKGRSERGQVPVRNLLVPFVSLAKRSLRRRRLRFLLTLASIAALVMSFVSLTSFTEGYDLITSRVSGSASNNKTVLVRANGYNYEDLEPKFIVQADAYSGWLEKQPESQIISYKVENVPLKIHIAMLNQLRIRGLLGIDQGSEAPISGINRALIDGELPSGDGVAISEALRKALGVEIGDTLRFRGINVNLVGILDDSVLSSMREIDGTSFLPTKLVILNPGADIPQYGVKPCLPSEIVVFHASMALNVPISVGIGRIAIKVTDGVNVNEFAQRLALEREYSVWAASAEGVYYYRIGSYLEWKGLALAIPWSIVVLNVVVTMLNSMYERRKEIHIFSSVGLNPAQIAAIFVVEASLIGLTGGGLGYLAGLGIYKGLNFFNLALEVRQKVSAIWSIASIGIAMTAVLIGAIWALQNSLVVTPSLTRKWKVESEMKSPLEPFEIVIPVKLLPEDVDDFVGFVTEGLKRLKAEPFKKTAAIKVFKQPEDAERRIDFVYKTVGPGMSKYYSKNNLLIEKVSEGELIVRLRSHGERSWTHATGSLVRMLAMRWSVS